VLAFQPARYDFGQVQVGERPDRTFTLENTGARASGALTLTVSGSAAFTVTADTCPPSLGPGKTCTVSVRFAPTGAGAANATLTAANKRGTVTGSAGLTGTGGGPETTSRFLYFTTVDGTVQTSTLNGESVFTLATDQRRPALMTADAGIIYWANLGGTINATSRTNSTVGTLVSGRSAPIGVAADASHIYWTDFADGTINQAPLNGAGSVTTLFSGQDGPVGIAVQAGVLYWTSGKGTIKKASVAGGPITILTTDTRVVGLAVDSTCIYWTTGAEGGDVKAYPLAGGQQSVLARGQNEPYGVAVDITQIFWTNQGDGTLNVAPLAGGTPKTLFDYGEPRAPVGVAVGQ
jgi:hypothetical protein